MYGALVAKLQGIHSALVFIIEAWFTWELAVATVAVFIVLRLVIPLAVVKGALALTTLVVIVGELGFCFWLRRVRRHLQRIRPIEERLPAPGSARKLFQLTMECVDESCAWKKCHGLGRSPEEWLEGWFLGAPFQRIKRDNLAEFIAWGLYTKCPEELTEDERPDFENMLAEMQERFGWQLPAGYDHRARCIRINFDPVKVWNHPLLYYASCGVLRVTSRRTMGLLGFTQESLPEGLSYLHYLPSSGPGVLTVNGIAPPKDTTVPIVFIHGLGVGLAPYLRFLRRLTSTLRECFAVELPEISQSGTHTVLPPQAMADAIAKMLQKHGHTRACFVAHSYGTFVASWVARFRGELIEKLILMDPVCLMLAQPDVAFNFLYRRPSNLFSLVVTNFVRWELFSANVLMRHFYWYHNVLWRDEFPCDTVVALAAKDDIVNAPLVRLHLEDPSKSSGKKINLKVLWFENFFHGEMMLSKMAQLQVGGVGVHSPHGASNLGPPRAKAKSKSPRPAPRPATQEKPQHTVGDKEASPRVGARGTCGTASPILQKRLAAAGRKRDLEFEFVEAQSSPPTAASASGARMNTGFEDIPDLHFKDEAGLKVAARAKGWVPFVNKSSGERGFWIPEVPDSVVYASWERGLMFLQPADEWCRERGKVLPKVVEEMLRSGATSDVDAERRRLEQEEAQCLRETAEDLRRRQEAEAQCLRETAEDLRRRQEAEEARRKLLEACARARERARGLGGEHGKDLDRLVKDTLAWLEAHPDATASEYDRKHRQFEDAVRSIFEKDEEEARRRRRDEAERLRREEEEEADRRRRRHEADEEEERRRREEEERRRREEEARHRKGGEEDEIERERRMQAEALARREHERLEAEAAAKAERRKFEAKHFLKKECGHQQYAHMAFKPSPRADRLRFDQPEGDEYRLGEMDKYHVASGGGGHDGTHNPKEHVHLLEHAIKELHPEFGGKTLTARSLSPAAGSRKNSDLSSSTGAGALVSPRPAAKSGKITGGT